MGNEKLVKTALTPSCPVSRLLPSIKKYSENDLVQTKALAPSRPTSQLVKLPLPDSSNQYSNFTTPDRDALLFMVKHFR